MAQTKNEFGWTLLATATASASATIDFEDYFASSAYSSYIVQGRDIVPATDDQELYVRYKSGGTWKTSAYRWAFRGSTGNGTAAGAGSASDVAMFIGHNTGTLSWGNGTGENFNFDAEFSDLSSTSNGQVMGARSWGFIALGTHGNFISTGHYTGDIAERTGIRFLMASGNIASGTFKLYGIN